MDAVEALILDLRYSGSDSSLYFYDPAEALDLPNVTVVTGKYSCSASELAINSLEPFIDVTVIGEVTCGKPIGMYDHEFCDKHLFPIELQLVHALDYMKTGSCPAAAKPDRRVFSEPIAIYPDWNI